jgi:hypothetical protein
MPINPSALSGDTTRPADQPAPSQAAADAGVTNEHEAAVVQTDSVDAPKRTRRTKAQMIADAHVPAQTDVVELKDLGTGAKIERQWLVALELVRDGKAEWIDKAMKYSMMKWDQMKAQGAFGSATPASEPAAAETQGEQTTIDEQIADATPTNNVPPEAEVGDEVRVGADTFRVGHGGVLTTSQVDQPAKRRWQRQLGAGADGPWEATVLQQTTPPPAEKAETNGTGGAELQVETERQPMRVEQLSEIEWKVGTGILEKIGLPQVEQFSGGSSLQVGPNTASRTVIDDGRRTTVRIGSREAELPTAVLEAYREITDAVEYVARYQRGELAVFLESLGILKQPA